MQCILLYKNERGKAVKSVLSNLTSFIIKQRVLFNFSRYLKIKVNIPLKRAKHFPQKDTSSFTFMLRTNKPHIGSVIHIIMKF